MQDVKAIIDIGNGYLKGTVLSKEEDKTTLLCKELMITKGLRKGKILDKEIFKENLEELIAGFQKKLGGDYIDEYVIGISHPKMKIQRLIEQKRVMNEKINNDDIKHLSNVIADISDTPEYETLKILPVYRIIDESSKQKDPIGNKATKLDIVADVFQIPQDFYDDMIEIVEALGIYVADIIPNIIATTEATMDYDNKDLGSISIDIGKNHTTYSLYEDGYPIIYETIPLGGDNITKDISIGMQIDIKEAENLKINYGHISLIDVNTQKDETVDTHFLAHIITARYEEIFNKVQKRLQQLERDGRLPGGVILSGGGSKTPGLEELAKEIFKLVIFKGTDKNNTTKELSDNAQFINSMGLYSWSEKYSESTGGLSLNLGSLNILQGIGNFFKKLF